MTTGEFIFDDNVLQTKGILQAIALSLRLDIALFSNFLVLLRETRKGDTKVSINLQTLRNECRTFIGDAEHYSRPGQQVEGYIFLAQLYTLERPYSPPELAETHLKRVYESTGKARNLCSTLLV
jgi:hypothetical protein